MLCLLIPVLTFAIVAQGKKNADTPATPIAWAYVRTGPVEVLPKPSMRQTKLMELNAGALLPILRFQSKGARQWALVHAMNLSKLRAQEGWIESSRIETVPYERYPRDADLLLQLGGPYLEDYTASHTEVTRLLLQQASHQTALVCFLTSRVVPVSRLVIFLPEGERFVAGPSMEFPASEMQAGIVALEARDLVGDGNKCLVTREPFRKGPETRGVTMVIRRLVDRNLETIWKAPIKFTSLDAYPARIQVLEPPEKNIGVPGTVTEGKVEFRPHGEISEPVWTGKVEFHVLGREAPVKTLPIEKVCTWDGKKFAPLE